MIHATLQQLGFSAKEIDIYLIILQNGKIAPADIAKLTKINRSTVYDIAKELMKRGVITEDLGASARYFIARPPQDLEQLIKKDEQELAQKKLLISSAVSELSSLAKNTRYSVPKIQFFSEDEIENLLYKHAPMWDESIQNTDGTWWGFQDYTLVQCYLKWIQWYNKTHPIQNVHLLSNTEKDDIVTRGATLHPNRRIRFWKETSDFTATIWIAGEYIVMVMTRQRPHYAIEIRDAVMAHNMRQVFKGIWNGLAE